LSFPLLDMTTTVTGLLCWRDSHPLEWQLASLHWPGRAPALQNVKSCGGVGVAHRVGGDAFLEGLRSRARNSHRADADRKNPPPLTDNTSANSARCWSSVRRPC
jgi:hypothetical protein